MNNDQKHNFNRPEKSNNAINLECKPYLQRSFILLKYEDMADFFTEEPNSVFVIKNEDGAEKLYEQIIRIRFWISNKKTFSWSIYGNDRNLVKAKKNGLVLRYAMWDREEDVMRLRSDGRDALANGLPSISSNTIFIYSKDTDKLINVLEKGECLTQKGIMLNVRKNTPQIIWRDLEYCRNYDWGSVNLIWSIEKENELLENYIFECDQIFNQYMKLEQKNVQKIVLNYTYLPDFIKKLWL